MLMSEMKEIDGDFSAIKSEMKLSKLTHHQLIGVKYFNDIEEPLKRNIKYKIKITEIYRTVKYKL